MSRALASAAGALTLAVSALTLPALAGDPPVPGGTPLDLRPSQPIELRPAPSGSSHAGVAVTVVVLGLAAAAWFYKRRSSAAPGARCPSINITARRTIGVRSELLIVEIDGQSMLLGVTPGSIQHLALLSDPIADKAEAAEVEPEAAPPIPRPVARSRKESRPAAPIEAPLEEQVKGLLRARRGE